VDALGMSLRNGDTTSCGCAYAAAGQLRKKPEGEVRESKRRACERRHAAVRLATRPFNRELFYFVRSEARHLRKLREQCTGVAHQVDHVIPLQSDLVCGLNNEFNLAVIPRGENQRK